MIGLRGLDDRKLHTAAAEESTIGRITFGPAAAQQSSPSCRHEFQTATDGILCTAAGVMEASVLHSGQTAGGSLTALFL